MKYSIIFTILIGSIGCSDKAQQESRTAGKSDASINNQMNAPELSVQDADTPSFESLKDSEDSRELKSYYSNKRPLAKQLPQDSNGEIVSFALTFQADHDEVQLALTGQGNSSGRGNNPNSNADIDSNGLPTALPAENPAAQSESAQSEILSQDPDETVDENEQSIQSQASEEEQDSLDKYSSQGSQDETTEEDPIPEGEGFAIGNGLFISKAIANIGMVRLHVSEEETPEQEVLRKEIKERRMKREQKIEQKIDSLVEQELSLELGYQEPQASEGTLNLTEEAQEIPPPEPLESADEQNPIADSTVQELPQSEPSETSDEQNPISEPELAQIAEEEEDVANLEAVEDYEESKLDPSVKFWKSFEVDLLTGEAPGLGEIQVEDGSYKAVSFHLKKSYPKSQNEAIEKSNNPLKGHVLYVEGFFLENAEADVEASNKVRFAIMLRRSLNIFVKDDLAVKTSGSAFNLAFDLSEWFEGIDIESFKAEAKSKKMAKRQTRLNAANPNNNQAVISEGIEASKKEAKRAELLNKRMEIIGENFDSKELRNLERSEKVRDRLNVPSYIDILVHQGIGSNPASRKIIRTLSENIRQRVQVK